MKLFKKILVVLLGLFVLLQAFRPEKNRSNDKTRDISNNHVMPLNIKNILAKACNDCHSNSTRYPWYSEIQPVGWWLADHVRGPSTSTSSMVTV